MKIARIDLFAFGPFTNARLDFSRRPGAFQLVYGANEAGKSTTLRALNALLYGIPARTADAHLHEMPRMRVGAELLDEHGKPLTLVRRKGAKNTLLDADDRPLPEAALARVLGGLDEATFRQMFGIDHERLREGAEALLRGGGHVSEGLFDAGTGGGAIRDVLERLKAEADELYKPKGTTTKVHVAVRALREHQRERKEAALSPQAFADQQRGLAEAVRARDVAVRRRHELLRDKARLARGLAVLPLLSRRRPFAAELEGLEGRPLLPQDTADRRLKLEARFMLVERELGRVEGELVKLKGALEEAPERVMPGVSHELVRELERRFGTYLGAAADLPRRREELEIMERERAALRAKLGSAVCALERLDTPARARLRVLFEEERSLRGEERELALRAAREHEEGLAADARFSAPPELRDASALEALLRELERDEWLAIERRLEAELARRGEAIERRLDQLGTALSSSALARLARPSEAELDELERDENAHAEEARDLEHKRRELDERAPRLERERALLLADGDVPTEQALSEARAVRDRALSPIATLLRTGTAPTDLSALRAFEHALRKSDELADRLRRETGRMSALARVEIETQVLSLEERAFEARAKAHAERVARLDARARALLEPLGVRRASVRASRAELRELAKLAEQALEHEALARELEVVRGRARERCAVLVRELEALGVQGPFRALLPAIASARAYLEKNREAAIKHAELSAQKDELARARAALERDVEAHAAAKRDFRTRFDAELERLGFSVALTVDELKDAVDELYTLQTKGRETDSLRARVESLEQANRSFEADLARLACEHLESTGGLTPAELLEALVRRQRERHDAERETERLVNEHTRLAALDGELRRERAALADERALLFGAAGVSSFEELKEAERHSERLREVSAALRALDEQLAGASQGAALEELEESTRSLDKDGSRAELEEIERELGELDNEIDALHHKIGGLEVGLARLEQASGAVALAEQSEACLASARRLVRRYAEVSLALAILSREVERYRAAHQGPVLSRAKQLLPRLTLDRYTGLDVELDDKDVPVLSCVRADGKRVRVEGLSDGTRDQLYLALRIASIERYLERNTPMPLVLDDAFVHFDDARAEAALNVLAELTARTQVIFFTHHARMVELAKGALRRDQLMIHELDPSRGVITARDDGPLFARL